MIESLENPGDLIILPEMFSTGFTMDVGAMADSMDGETITWMREMARRHGACVCGSIIIE
jgi:predicted amidohydrolase